MLMPVLVCMWFRTLYFDDDDDDDDDDVDDDDDDDDDDDGSLPKGRSIGFDATRR